MLWRWYRNLEISHKILVELTALFIAFIFFIVAKDVAKTILLILLIFIILNLMFRGK